MTARIDREEMRQKVLARLSSEREPMSCGEVRCAIPTRNRALVYQVLEQLVIDGLVVAGEGVRRHPVRAAWARSSSSKLMVSYPRVYSLKPKDSS